MSDSTITNYLVTMIAVSMFVAAGVMAMGELTRSSDFTGDQNSTHYNTTYNKLAELQQKTDQLNKSIQSPDDSENKETGFREAFGFIDTIFNTAVQTLKVIAGSISASGSIISAAGTDLGLPGWVAGGVIAIIISILGVAILGAFIKYRV